MPWVRPWGAAAAKAPLAMHCNAAVQRCYTGVNVLILWGTVVERGFAAQSWPTFRQALGFGGNVREGECGTSVVYADRFRPDDERRRAAEVGQAAQSISFLKRFTVFNVARCDGLTEALTVVVPSVDPDLVLPQAEALIRRPTSISGSAEKERSMPGGAISCRFPGRKLSSNRSIGAGRRCMSSVTPAGRPIA